jgi:hypothetical protein
MSLAGLLVLVLVVALLRIGLHQRTLFAWQDAESTAAMLVGTGDWTVTMAAARCGNADP